MSGGMLATIGRTPVVRVEHLVEPGMGEVWVKLESANPTGSYKDRMALAMIEGAERAGRLRAGSDGRRVHGRQHGLVARVRLRAQGLSAADRHLGRLLAGEAAHDGRVRRGRRDHPEPGRHHSRPDPADDGAREGDRRGDRRVSDRSVPERGHGRGLRRDRRRARGAARRADRRLLRVRRDRRAASRA